MTWQKLDNLFTTVAAGTVTLNMLRKAFVDGLIDNDEKVASSKNTYKIKD